MAPAIGAGHQNIKTSSLSLSLIFDEFRIRRIRVLKDPIRLKRSDPDRIRIRIFYGSDPDRIPPQKRSGPDPPNKRSDPHRRGEEVRRRRRDPKRLERSGSVGGKDPKRSVGSSRIDQFGKDLIRSGGSIRIFQSGGSGHHSKKNRMKWHLKVA